LLIYYINKENFYSQIKQNLKMANGNNQRLKAYVRFDGSGRVVAGSLILRQNKPKVGKWQEITAYECCNPTTTTTTTVAPTTTTTTTVEPTTTTTTTNPG
jgi:hypothetical protein